MTIARRTTQNGLGRPATRRKGQERVAVAWLFGEITYTQAVAGLGLPRRGSGYSALCAGLREAVSKGMVLPAKKAGKQR